MSEAPKVGPGVLCEVVWGLEGDQSPNLGLVVSVTRLVGQHEDYGPIWEAENEYGIRPEYSKVHRPISPGKQDYAESWLRPLPWDKQKSQGVKELDTPADVVTA